MPSFQEERLREAAWAEFPALERLPDPAGARAALTFDDGPDPEGTPEVLDALDAVGVRATFFVVGEQLQRSPRLGGELLRRGHEVALHCFDHRRQSEMFRGQVRDDIARGLGAVEAATGRRPRFFRPPYGVLTEAGAAACADLALEPVAWSAWGLDWEPIPAARIAELVARDIAPGAIVLLHDSARYAARESVSATTEAIPAIAAAAAEAGVELGPLGAALGGAAGDAAQA